MPSRLLQLFSCCRRFICHTSAMIEQKVFKRVYFFKKIEGFCTALYTHPGSELCAWTSAQVFNCRHPLGMSISVMYTCIIRSHFFNALASSVVKCASPSSLNSLFIQNSVFIPFCEGVNIFTLKQHAEHLSFFCKCIA